MGSKPGGGHMGSKPKNGNLAEENTLKSKAKSLIYISLEVVEFKPFSCILGRLYSLVWTLNSVSWCPFGPFQLKLNSVIHHLINRNSTMFGERSNWATLI